MRPVLAFVLSLTLACALAACSTPTPYAPKEQTQLDITITAADDVNPDDKERAAPIMVRFYELKSENTFEAADYFSLHNNDKTLLAADLLARDEFILRPGDVKSIRRKSHPDITAIGVLAGYRDLPNATWRVVHTLPPAPEASWYRSVIPANKAKLQIQLESQGIRLTTIE
ncbi:type VI secretion system lipoprotein TssJ [Variovorax ureilyticus]|uniref:Type VI secretion system lipoprotein TssJ n=1 Tax=Variovorax ureilyticus TaxID=1836198 RepID=A0ABU8VCS8_9BURK